MSIQLNQTAKAEGSVGKVFTYGSALPTGPHPHRFGGAHRDGTVGLHDYVSRELTYTKLKCSTYRKAQRKLLQWLKGYNVCSK